ncbi:hypothetical protein M422DRAFT_253216 [Sphaerobolus stellatus SS14]|uniref:Tf2-1-like SH3-like domain-containing protein n=1 Tax=Sphaerobolus stellatus (strain SS14) TaxID=990650 RepID=A0A0C9VNM1_SPHS4|nr:hypothetical protein M422DRAFT_253216 [Sphaerobolus stellatus SS14]
MAAHDEVIAGRVKQMVQANKRRHPADFDKGDLVYLSTKNLKLPKKRARKLTPKYIGPFRIVDVIEKGATYKLEMSKELKKRGVNPTYHASLLQVHILNDDRRFPGHQLAQLPGFGEKPREWAVERILQHSGKGVDSSFEVLWNTGDKTWFNYNQIKGIEALETYLEAMGVKRVADLPRGRIATLNVVSADAVSLLPTLNTVRMNNGKYTLVNLYPPLTTVVEDDTTTKNHTNFRKDFVLEDEDEGEATGQTGRTWRSRQDTPHPHQEESQTHTLLPAQPPSEIGTIDLLIKAAAGNTDLVNHEEIDEIVQNTAELEAHSGEGGLFNGLFEEEDTEMVDMEEAQEETGGAEVAEGSGINALTH